MRCSRLAYPLGLFVLSGALVVLDASSENSSVAAEHGPEVPPHATADDSGGAWYYSGRWHDEYGNGSANDPYWHETYGDVYPYGSYNDTHQEYDGSEIEDASAETGNSVSEQEAEAGKSAGATDQGKYSEYGYDEYGYDGDTEDGYYNYYEHESYRYGQHAKDEDDYWQEEYVTDRADSAQMIEEETEDVADVTETYADTEYPSDDDMRLDPHDGSAHESTEGYDPYGYHEYGYDCYGDYYYGDGGRQDTPKEAAIEQADDLSEVDSYQEAGVVDRYGYWDSESETSEESVSFPSGSEELIEADNASKEDAPESDDTIYGDDNYREYNYGDEYENYYGDYYYGKEYDSYQYDYNSKAGSQYSDDYDDEYGYEYGYEYNTGSSSGSEARQGAGDESDTGSSDASSSDSGTEHDDHDYDYYDYCEYDYEYNTDYNEVDEPQNAGDDTVASGSKSSTSYDDCEYDYDYDYCEYGDEYEYRYEYVSEPAAKEQTFEGSTNTADTTGMSRYMEDLDPFAWPAGDLLLSSDKDLLRKLNRLFEESGSAREAVLYEHIEGLGLEAVEFVARFEEAFGNQRLMLQDDLPGVAALLATYRMIEQGEFGMDEAVEVLQRQFDCLSPEWIEDVSLIITEQPNHSVRSDHSPGEGSVLRAVIVASARSVGSVGLGLSSVLNDLTSLPGRLGRIGDATGWTVPGTATVPSWNAR